MVALFNTLGVDAVVFGNHEFDFGPEVTQQRLAGPDFPGWGRTYWGLMASHLVGHWRP